jgi:hypothetical protein
MNCPKCGDVLAERGVYCKACGSQARCLSCKSVLEPGAAACVECGSKVGEVVSSSGTTAVGSQTTIASNRNTLSYREDRGSRLFDASLTDHAMEGLGAVLGELFVQRGQVRASIAARQSILESPTLEAQTELPLLPAAIVAPVIPTQTEPKAPISEIAGQIATFFTADGDRLELIDNRLKASNQSDYVRRLTVLFLYAHEVLGRSSTSEDEIKAVLKESKVWDRAGNAAKWLKKRIGLADTGEDRLKLTAPGRDEAKKALAQAVDPNIQDAWNPDKQVSKPRASRGTKKP